MKVSCAVREGDDEKGPYGTSSAPYFILKTNGNREGVVEFNREAVDIIYFPTGGGKTKAYLATIVFHCFLIVCEEKRRA